MPTIHPHPHRRGPSRRNVHWLLVAGGLLATGCGSDLADAEPSPSIAAAPAATPTTLPVTAPVTAPPADLVGTALSAGSFSQLAGMLLDAQLVEVMRGGPFTVFAPTNEAFRALPLDALHAVQDDPETLARVLTYHVVSGTLMADDLRDGPLETVSGESLTISHDRQGNVLVDGKAIAAADVTASNGVIHVMDDVLMPSD